MCNFFTNEFNNIELAEDQIISEEYNVTGQVKPPYDTTLSSRNDGQT